MQDSLSIGAPARETGVKVVTVRYYESIGLLPKPARTKGNYRTYTAKHLDRLAFIRRCRDLGFTLDQIRELLAMTAAHGHVDEIARTHLAEVDRKVEDLQKLAQELRRIVRQCHGGAMHDCRIVEALSDKAKPRRRR